MHILNDSLYERILSNSIDVINIILLNESDMLYKVIRALWTMFNISCVSEQLSLEGIVSMHSINLIRVLYVSYSMGLAEHWGRLSIKMPSCQYRDIHVSEPAYL